MVVSKKFVINREEVELMGILINGIEIYQTCGEYPTGYITLNGEVIGELELGAGQGVGYIESVMPIGGKK